MIAALLLQRYQARLFTAPEISVLQVANPGPTSLIAHLPTAFTVTEGGLWTVTVLMTAVTLSLQLTSTALLSDVGKDSIVITYSNDSIPYGISSNSPCLGGRATDHSIDAPLYAPRSFYFPAFAEYSEAPADLGQFSQDTGTSILGFLPIPDQPQRENALSYKGMVTVVDTRVLCFRPSFEALDISFDGELKSSNFRLSGSIRTNDKLPGDEAPAVALTTFTCTFRVQEAEIMFAVDITDWSTSICQLDITSAMKSVLYPHLPPEEPRDSPELIHRGPRHINYSSSTYLFINTTGRTSDWSDWFRSKTGNSNPTRLKFDAFSRTSSDGPMEWATVLSEDAFALSITVCAINPLSRNIPVSLSRSRAGPEPSAPWKVPERQHNDPRYTPNPNFDTRGILAQLGATTNITSRAQRIIYDLPKPETWTTPNVELLPIPNSHKEQHPGQPLWGYSDTGKVSAYPAWFMEAIRKDVKSLPATLCPTTCHNETAAVARATFMSSIFQSVVRDSGSVAHAFQAMIKIWAATAYYESIPYFDATAPAEIGLLTEVEKPVQLCFLATVSTALLLHLILVAVVAVTFALAGDDLIIGGAWAALAPLCTGEDTTRWLPWTSRLTDKQVKKYMKSVGEDGIVVGLESTGDQLRLRRKGPKYESLNVEAGYQ